MTQDTGFGTKSLCLD